MGRVVASASQTLDANLPIVAFHVFPRFLGGRIVAAVKAHTRVDERQRESWARS